MDPEQLRQATRTIARLVRSNAVRKSRQKDKTPDARSEPEQRPEGYRQIIRLGCDATDLDNLDKILARLKRDPVFGRMKRLGREKAALVAIAHFAEHGPERITTTG